MKNDNEKPSFYAIIPANVRYCDNLQPNAKLLYGEITALSNKEGYCWASNEYFAALYKKRIETISVWISQLKKNNFIKLEFENTQNGIHRKIYIGNESTLGKSNERKPATLEKSKEGTLEKSKVRTLEKSKVINTYALLQDNNTKDQDQNIAAETAAAPAAEKNPSKPVADPRVKEIHDFYLENHPLKENYFPNFGKERKIIKNLLAVLNANGHAVEIITERLTNYFKSGFYAATGWGLESFVKNFNAFVAPQNNQNQKPVKPAKPVRKPGGGFHAITNPYED